MQSPKIVPFPGIARPRRSVLSPWAALLLCLGLGAGGTSLDRMMDCLETPENDTWA